MKARVAINGFGRIGRMSFQANLLNEKVDIVAINNPGSVKELAHLLKYDSTYGTLDAEISYDENHLIVNGKKILFTSILNPEELPWAENNIDIVLECTGIFRKKADAEKHLKAGAKKVILSAPGKDFKATYCMGINHQDIKKDQTLLSNASCTTNCLTPICKVLDENFGIEKGAMTTIHSYTGDQNILDNTHKKDIRRARAAALSMIPTSTGAAKALSEVIPSLDGKISGMAVRVPTPTVSMVDLVVELKKETTSEEINAAFKKAANGELKGILGYEEEELVSSDFKQNSNSSIVDASLTKANGKLVKVISWYDNEWGYSERIIDMAKYVHEL